MESMSTSTSAATTTVAVPLSPGQHSALRSMPSSTDAGSVSSDLDTMSVHEARAMRALKKVWQSLLSVLLACMSEYTAV